MRTLCREVLRETSMQTMGRTRAWITDVEVTRRGPQRWYSNDGPLQFCQCVPPTIVALAAVSPSLHGSAANRHIPTVAAAAAMVAVVTAALGHLHLPPAVRLRLWESQRPLLTPSPQQPRQHHPQSPPQHFPL